MKEKIYTMCVRCAEKAKVAYWNKEIVRLGDIDFFSKTKCRCGNSGIAEYVMRDK